MSTFVPIIQAVAGRIEQRDMRQDTPPLWYHGFANAMNAEPSGLNNARYIEPLGEVWGAWTPTMQDTYLTGTGSRSGVDCTADAGTWKDDAVSPWSDRYMLLQPDSTLASWGVHVTTPGTALTPSLIILRMGLAPAANASAHTPGNIYAYLELAKGYATNYRLCFEWGQPIRLEYTDQTLTGWLRYAIARELGSVENYLAHHNNEIRLTILPDYAKGLLVVEVGDGHWLRGPVPRPSSPVTNDAPGNLPTFQQRYFYGAYRWASMEIYPLTFANPSVTKVPRHFGNDRLKNLENAQIYANLAGRDDDSQTISGTHSQDGNGNLSYTATFTTDDNTIAPRFSDVVIYIPSTWRAGNGGYPLPETFLSRRRIRLLEVWDDATRMGMISARLLSDNSRGLYTGAYGNYAVNLIMGNGYEYAQVMNGIIGGDPEGIKLSRHDPYRFVEFPLHDFWAKLAQVELNQEVTLDGLCIYTAIQLLLDIGQVNPALYALNIPQTGMPPPGGYPVGFPYYILGKGSGNNPKYRYPPNATVLSVLQDLVQDSGDPNTGYPHYMYFDVFGQFHWDAYDPRTRPLVGFYSDTDTTGQGAIHDIQVYNSIADLRSGITVQGQDALAYDLIQYSLPLPGNFGAIGYQVWSTERKANYASPAYLERIANILAIQASKPSQIVRMLVPYWPSRHAGDRVIIQERSALGRTGEFTILEIDSTVGYDAPYTGPHGNHCESWMTCRSIENSLL